MTNEQKLSKAIQDEIGKRSMRELALNSLRYQVWQNACDPDEQQTRNIDIRIIASIPDDGAP